MTRKLLLFAALTLTVATASAQTVEEIVSKYVTARGGLDKIKAVKTERIRGTISFGPDADGPFTVERLRPLKMRIEMTLNGQTLIRTYDGKSTGWIYNPFAAKPEVQTLTGRLSTTRPRAIKSSLWTRQMYRASRRIR